MRKTKATKVELPYRKTLSSKPVAEDVALATKMFGGNCYEMILAASLRAYEISKGSPSRIKEVHKPTVTAVLEIQQGLIDREYFFGEKR
jgi:DNA-directed RNA polymerase subunit K/omega